MRSLLLITGLLVFISCTSFNPNAVIVTIGKEQILFDEFELYATTQTRTASIKAVKDEDKELLLNKYIDLTVLTHYAEQEGLAEEEKFQSSLQRNKTMWTAQYYYWNELIKQLYTPDDIRNFYDRMDSEFRVRHILVGFKGARNSNLERSKEEALQIIENIYEEAVKGEVDFAELAKNKSEGPSAPEGGALNPFGVGKMTKPFEDAVFELKVGEISKPVETEFGFHIIKLEGIDDKNLKTSLDDPNDKVRVYQAMLSLKGREAQQLFNEMTDSLRKKNRLCF